MTIKTAFVVMGHFHYSYSEPRCVFDTKEAAEAYIKAPENAAWKKYYDSIDIEECQMELSDASP
jgi:hypothetical protein